MLLILPLFYQIYLNASSKILEYVSTRFSLDKDWWIPLKYNGHLLMKYATICLEIEAFRDLLWNRYNNFAELQYGVSD